MKNKSTWLMTLWVFLIVSLSSITLQAQDYVVYPIPQKMTMGQQSFSLTGPVNVVVEEGIDENIVQRMQEVLENAGYTYVLNDTFSEEKTNLLIGIAGSGQTVDRYAKEHQVPADVFVEAENKFDSHVLQLNLNHPQGDILVLGDAQGSAYYAFATLEQLLEQSEGSMVRMVTFEDYAYVKMRGIVEGFYGHTYSVENRLDLFDYCKRYKMNTYFYGPKSDPYHTGLWRDNYPESVTEQQRFMGQIDQEDIRRLAVKAKSCHVDFIWSVHPALQGGGIDFYNLDPGVNEIMKKFQHMYDLGIRHFGVSVDDMPGHPTTQHELADKVQRKLLEKYNAPGTAEADQVGPLLFVPSQYALNYGTYTLPAFQSVHKDIEVVFTGYDCFSNIRAYAFDMMNDLVGRKPVMWWNNPVNDDHDDYLYMHGMTARWVIEDKDPISTMAGLIMNPMNQPQASKICLFGAADYAWNPAAFHSDTNWQASLQSVLHEQPLHEALMEFIRVMSSYSQTDDGEEYAPLYRQFMRNYSKGKVPETTELLEAMDRAYESCLLLQSLEKSEKREYRLFYEDIAPWLNKVQSMTDIVRRSVRLMSKGADLADWTAVTDILEDISRLHKDSVYFLSVLEGSGTDTYETFREAQPTPKSMDKFITYLSEKIVDFVPEIPARNREMEIITNQKTSTAIVDLTAGLALAGLKNLTLNSGDYVGVNMKAIKTVTVESLPESQFQGLTSEWSLSGKEWTPFRPDGKTSQEMAYFRLKNHSDKPSTLSVERIGMALESEEERRPGSASTNMGNYQYYVVDYVIDGNMDTKFWSNREQQAGDFIKVDYGKSVSFSDIEFYFEQNDQPTGTAAVEISKDGGSWETVGRFTAADLRNQVYTCHVNGKSARFVRLLIEDVTQPHWFQLKEIKAKGINQITVARDNKGNGIDVLDDSQLTVGYKAEDAGHLIYQFIENLNIDEVQIFHHSKFDPVWGLPQISVLNEGEWYPLGELDEPCTRVSLAPYTKPSQLKIEWNAKNIPALYEIYVTGEPYQEDITTEVADIRQSTALTFRVQEKQLSICAPTPLQEIIVTDAQGRVRGIYQPSSTTFDFTLPEEGFWMVKVRTQNGLTEVHKLLIQ